MQDGGRSRSDPRVSAPRAFLLSRRDLPAPSSRAALQRRARAWYSGRGRGSGRGLRRPRGRKRRGGKRCVFILFLLPFRSPLPLFHFVSFVFPTNVTAVTLTHPQPTPGYAHALPSPSFLAQLLTSGQRQPPPPRLPLHPSLPFPRPMPLLQSNAQVRFLGCRCCRCCHLFYPSVSADPAAILRDISLCVFA